MKTKVMTTITLLALSASPWVVSAQDNDGPPPVDRPPQGERQGEFDGPRRPQRQFDPAGPAGQRDFNRNRQRNFDRDGQRPPPPPLIAALDANHDGVIDDVEISNASAALRKLDKNGDGKLTREELRPPVRDGFGSPGQPGGRVGPRQGRPDGQRGPRGPEDRGPGGFGGQRVPAGERPPPPPPEN